jgi:glycosyltransferase involved in cell wall biosynthesis/peptidoglycan/xylan/chitin deacetylase (PgdA/CDA1 family)
LLWKFYIKKIAKYLLLPSGYIYRIFFQTADEIVILMYHRVNNHIPKELAVTEKNFKWQMNYLKRNHYRIISLNRAYEMMKVKTIKGKYLVLTFDDGYEDFFYNAFPILKEHNYPAIVYLVPGFIETGRVFWWDSDLGESRLLNWSQINDLGDSKLVTFGSHTKSHCKLDQLNVAELRDELEGSRKILEQRLNQPVEHFCYPQGIHTETATGIVSSLYQTGVLILNGQRNTNQMKAQDFSRLKRIPIQNSDGRALFVAKIKGWLIGEEILRKLCGKIINRLSADGSNKAESSQKRLKLLLGITLSELGGAQKVVYELVSALVEEHYEITIVTSPGGELIQWISDLNLKRKVKIAVKEIPCLGRPISPINDFKAFYQIYRLLASNHYDIAHFHSSKMGILGPYAAFLARVPRILFTVHGWGINQGQSFAIKTLLGFLTGIATRFCSDVICVSHYDRDRGLQNHWVSPKKCRVIHNGMGDPPSTQGKLHRELGIDRQIPIIGMIARLAEPKNPMFAIKIAEQLQADHHDFRLVIIGDGPMRYLCEREIAAADLESKVVLLGTRMDARELLNDIDIFALFSKWEALPLTVIEAMFAGKPVIASKVGGIPELVRHGENGYLIEEQELDRAVVLLEEMLMNKDICRHMGQMGQKRAYQDFSRPMMMVEYEKMYRGQMLDKLAHGKGLIHDESY